MISVTGSIQGSQAAPEYAGDPGNLQLASGGSPSINPGTTKPGLPPVTIITPTPNPTLNPAVRNTTISPNHTLDNIPYSHLTDGFFTNSSLLYVLGPKNVTVIEADTNKIVDVIYLDKYMLVDAVVSPDNKKLYVLYHDLFDPARVNGWEGSDYGNFILTIDLETKQIIDDTWYRDYVPYLKGTASDLVLSPDGRYLYYDNNGPGGAVLFEYDTALHKYTKGVITEEYYGKDAGSNVYDLALASDGKRLYFADTNGRLTFVNLPDLSLNRWYKTAVADYHPWTAAVSADGNTAYLAGDSQYATGGYSLVSMDLPAIVAKEQDSTSVLGFNNLPAVVRLGQGEKTLFVLQPSKKRVLAYNIDEPALFWTYPAGNMTEDFVLSNDGKWIYIYSYGNNYVSVYDWYSRQKAAGSPIRLGPDWGADSGWHPGGNHKMVIGPDPQDNIFVNDSAYRAQKMLQLASVIEMPSVSHFDGALELNESSGTGSSFYFDYSLGKTVYVNFSAPGSTAKPTVMPGYDLSFSGAVTIRPFPGEQIVTPGPQDNQTQNQSQQGPGNVSATPGSTGDTPKPAAGATSTPGFDAVACLACLAGVFLLAAKKWQ